MSTFNTCKETNGGNILLPKAKMIYPNLLEPVLPRGEKDESKKRYQITLLFPKTANLDLLVTKIEACIEENLTAALRKTTKVKKPFLKTADQPRLEEYAADYPIMLRLATKQKPDVVGPNPSVRIDDESELYHGRFCRVSARPFWFDHPTGGKGVSVGLQNVQLLDHDEPMNIGGGKSRAEDEFEEAGEANSSAAAMFG